MYPHTRALLESMRSEEGFEPEAAHEDVAHHDDPRVLALKLKRKHYNNLLRQMMQNAGYTDLARMSGIRRETLEDGDG